MITKSDLSQFTGTSVWYRHPLVRNVTYTEGVQYLAEQAEAYWLIDEVACHQLEPKIANEPFQVWKLVHDAEGSGAELIVEDGNYNAIWRKRIEYTDFPLSDIELWFTDNVILLPSEY